MLCTCVGGFTEREQHEQDGKEGVHHPFLQLGEEVHLYILAFCDAYELWSFGWTNRSFRAKTLDATLLYQELTVGEKMANVGSASNTTDERTTRRRTIKQHWKIPEPSPFVPDDAAR